MSTFRRFRQGTLVTLLVAVAIWALIQWRADHHVFAWERPINVLVVCVSDPSTDTNEDVLRGFLARFLSTGPALENNISGASKWFADEFQRHNGRPMAPLKLTARGPIKALTPPPLPPDADAPFLDRWRMTSAFLGFFRELDRREKLVMAGYDATIFVYFYGEAEARHYVGQHSIASRRDRLGVVFSAVGPRHFARCATVLAHELCHTLGASDKYDGEKSAFPDGYAEPAKIPLYPQRKAEIMALGIPLSADTEDRVDSLLDCVVGNRTAQEMGWGKP